MGQCEEVCREGGAQRLDQIQRPFKPQDGRGVLQDGRRCDRARRRLPGCGAIRSASQQAAGRRPAAAAAAAGHAGPRLPGVHAGDVRRASLRQPGRHPGRDRNGGGLEPGRGARRGDVQGRAGDPGQGGPGSVPTNHGRRRGRPDNGRAVRALRREEERRARGGGCGRHGGRPLQGHVGPRPQHRHEADGHHRRRLRRLLHEHQRRQRRLLRRHALHAQRRRHCQGELGAGPLRADASSPPRCCSGQGRGESLAPAGPVFPQTRFHVISKRTFTLSPPPPASLSRPMPAAVFTPTGARPGARIRGLADNID
mmetsp:Transcript_30703/g.64267  ORF Transcript_30703/g.64267 Transcript_30703/m.64267 type:complete len:311 (-) Transcript_30703:25-957(-)